MGFGGEIRSRDTFAFSLFFNIYENIIMKLKLFLGHI